MHWLQVTSQLILTSGSYLQSLLCSPVLEHVPQTGLELRVFLSVPGESCPTGTTKDLSLSTLSTCNNSQATCTTQEDLPRHGHPMIYGPWGRDSQGFTAIFFSNGTATSDAGFMLFLGIPIKLTGSPTYTRTVTLLILSNVPTG